MDSFGKVREGMFNFWLSHLITYHIYLPVVTPILSNETWCDSNKKKWKNDIVTHWNCDDGTMPRCTNKWSTPNKAWSHHGKTASPLRTKGFHVASTSSLRSDCDTQGSHSVHQQHPHHPRETTRHLAILIVVITFQADIGTVFRPCVRVFVCRHGSHSTTCLVQLQNWSILNENYVWKWE